jgi:xanthine dehydrogenase iron-sulfur cluster and FAD-binding subunit A
VLHAVQQAFITHGGAQCGICTPGMVLASVTLLERTANPNDEQIRAGLAGNLCRCTGYMRIFEGEWRHGRRRFQMRAYLPAYDLRAPDTLSEAVSMLAAAPARGVRSPAVPI